MPSDDSTVVSDGGRFYELVEKFLLSHDVKPISREGYRRRLKNFFDWCIKTQNLHPNRETILEYKRYLQGRKFTPYTEAAYLVAVRCFFAWLESVKLYPNVAKGIRAAKKQKGFRRDPLTIEQVRELLSCIERSTLKGKRDYALVNLMIRTGPRTIEITRANIEDIRQQSGKTVLWLQGKGADAKDAFVVLTRHTLDPIMDYIAIRGTSRGDEPLFGSTSDGNLHQRLSTRSIRRIVKERFRDIKLDSPRLSAHSLRHTTVTLALLAGVTVQEAQQLARHSDINTTMIYAQNLDRSAGIPEMKIDSLLEGS